MVFKDRIAAAQALIPFLVPYALKPVVVLAIPRGGVPMGKEIATHFGWPLSVMLTKKIGHPMNKEYAIGAVGLDAVLLDKGHPEVPEFYVKEETERMRLLLEDRYKKFLGTHRMESVKGKSVVIVDDGIATGYTIKMSVEILKKQQPDKIIIAVPVATPKALKAIRKLVDDVIVLHTPLDFIGVGQYYNDFSEVTDEDVQVILQKYDH